MKFRGTEDTQVHKMCAHFFMFGHRRSSWRKEHNLAQKTLKKIHYFVFSLERLVRHLITKTCKHLVHSSLFEAKKIQLFLNFVAIFLNLLFIGINYFCFPLL